jgi:hypothetical protein
VASRTARRAERLATLHAEVRRLIRHAALVSQPDLFNRAAPHVRTAEAAAADRTVTLSLRETFDLFRAAMPPTAHDACSRRRHALLVVAMRHFIDTLRGLDSDTVTPAVIAAGELVGRAVRTWLRAAERPAIKRAARKPTTAQPSLLLPLNRIQHLRQETTQNHNAIPLRSAATADFNLTDDDLSKPDTTENADATKLRITG